jgi:hypothetical protein
MSLKKLSNKVVEHRVRYVFDRVNHFACTDPLNIGCNENVACPERKRYAPINAHVRDV